MCETTSRREAEGSSLTHPTSRDQYFSLLPLIPCCIIQKQHDIEASSKNYWSRGIGCVRLLPDAKRREVASRINTEGPVIFTTFRNKPCCICTIPHKYFTS